MKTWRLTIPVLMAFLVALILVPAVAADSTYVVKPGDNLFRIALNHGLTTQQLAQANGIVNPAYIYAGQVLTIPDGSTPESTAAASLQTAPETTSSTYLVQRGDTLFRIAVRYGLSTYTLAQANGIVNTNFIYAGQVLTIPASDGSGTTSGTGAPSPPASSVPQFSEARWIDVNLSNQLLTAYEGTTPVLTTYISSGRWAYPTVTGQFRVWLRYESQNMSGYRLGFDYYLPNVPYVMYFYRDYAIHGTYWHNNFGTPMSHGCVNMTIDQARWLYYWSDYGTLVNVHY